jgi:hypothetical protein
LKRVFVQNADLSPLRQQNHPILAEPVTKVVALHQSYAQFSRAIDRGIGWGQDVGEGTIDNSIAVYFGT